MGGTPALSIEVEDSRTLVTCWIQNSLHCGSPPSCFIFPSPCPACTPSRSNSTRQNNSCQVWFFLFQITWGEVMMVQLLHQHTVIPSSDRLHGQWWSHKDCISHCTQLALCKYVLWCLHQDEAVWWCTSQKNGPFSKSNGPYQAMPDWTKKKKGRDRILCFPG